MARHVRPMRRLSDGPVEEPKPKGIPLVVVPGIVIAVVWCGVGWMRAVRRRTRSEMRNARREKHVVDSVTVVTEPLLLERDLAHHQQGSLLPLRQVA